MPISALCECDPYLTRRSRDQFHSHSEEEEDAPPTHPPTIQHFIDAVRIFSICRKVLHSCNQIVNQICPFSEKCNLGDLGNFRVVLNNSAPLTETLVFKKEKDYLV